MAKMQDWRLFLSEPSSLSNMIKFRAQRVWEIKPGVERITVALQEQEVEIQVSD